MSNKEYKVDFNIFFGHTFCRGSSDVQGYQVFEISRSSKPCVKKYLQMIGKIEMRIYDAL